MAVLPAEPALDLLFTGEDAPVDRHSHKRPPLHVLTKCAAPDALCRQCTGD